MDEVDRGQPDANPVPPATAGGRLREAREARGLSLAEVAGRTRVPQRHLEALESGNYNALPATTYAMGFAKAYARAIGIDEVSIGQQVRGELDRLGPRQPEYVPYETADPARVPSRGVAVIGAGVALAVLILVALWYGTTMFQGYRPGQAATGPVASQTIAAAPTPAARPTPAVPTGGQVRLTANDEVWLRVYDADNKTLYLGTMKAGDAFDVPPDAKQPMINVGRPDKLAVTLNGSATPPLGDGSRAIKDVRVDAAAVAARLSGQPQPAASPSAQAATRSAARSPSPSRVGTSGPGETRRANLESSQVAQPLGNSTAP